VLTAWLAPRWLHRPTLKEGTPLAPPGFFSCPTVTWRFVLNPCPVRSLRVVFHESRVLPSSHERTAWQLAREALGAKLAETSAINGRISIHTLLLAPCMGQLSSYCVSERLLNPCSPTCWAFFGSLEAIRSMVPPALHMETIGPKNERFSMGPKEWRSRGSGTWLLGRRAVDCFPVPEAWIIVC
jgi:hypothetical protein